MVSIRIYVNSRKIDMAVSLMVSSYELNVFVFGEMQIFVLKFSYPMLILIGFFYFLYIDVRTYSIFVSSSKIS